MKNLINNCFATGSCYSYTGLMAPYCFTHCHLALNKVKQLLLGTALTTHRRQFRQSCTNRELAGWKMNCKWISLAQTLRIMQPCVLNRVVFSKSLINNILTKNSCLHVLINLKVSFDVPLVVWMGVCTCLHITCMSGCASVQHLHTSSLTFCVQCWRAKATAEW